MVSKPSGRYNSRNPYTLSNGLLALATSVCRLKPSAQDSLYGSVYKAELGIDENYDRRHYYCTHTGIGAGWHWWAVNLQHRYSIRYVKLINRIG